MVEKAEIHKLPKLKINTGPSLPTVHKFKGLEWYAINNFMPIN